MLDRQLTGTRGAERGWALLLRVDFDHFLGELETARADVERARKAFGADVAGQYACRLRILERLTRRYDPAAPALVDELERDYSPNFPERERVRYWASRFAYEVMRGNVRSSQRLLEQALAQATLPDVRANMLGIKSSMALSENEWSALDSLQAEFLTLWPQGPPALITLQLLDKQANVAAKRDQWNAARTMALAQLALARHPEVLSYELSAWRLLQSLAERQERSTEARAAWETRLALTRRLKSVPLRTETLIGLISPRYPFAPIESELAPLWSRLAPEERYRLELSLADALSRHGSESGRGVQLITEGLVEYRRVGDVEAQIQAHSQLARAAPDRVQALNEYAEAWALREAHPLPDPGWAPPACRTDQVAGNYARALLVLGRDLQAFQVCRQACARPLAEDARAMLLVTALRSALPGEIQNVRWCVDELERTLPSTGAWVRSYALKEFATLLPASELTPTRLARFQQHYRESLDTLSRTGTPTELVQAHLGRAVVLERLGDTPAQLQALEQARELAQRHTLSDKLNDVRSALLAYSEKNGRDERSLALAQEILADPRAARQHEAALRIGSQAYRHLKKPQEAYDWLLRRDRLLRSQKRGDEADKYLAGLAQLSEELKETEQALHYWQEMTSCSNLSQEERIWALSQQARLQKSPELAARALDEAARAEAPLALCQAATVYIQLRPDEVSEVAPRVLNYYAEHPELPRVAQARADLLANLAYHLARRGRVPELVDLLRRYPSAEFAPLLASSSTLREIAELRPFLSASSPRPAEKPLGALLDELRMARPELGNLLTLRSTNIAKLQARLAPHQLLVGYYPVGEELYVIGLARDATYQQRLAVGATRLHELVSGLSFGDPSQKVRDNGLAQLLVEPLEPWLEGKTELLTVPTGAVWRIPLAALQTQDGRYLGERIALSQLSSGDLLRLADGSYQPYRRGPALAIGAPPDVDLPGAERELRFVPGAELRLGAKARLDGPGPWKLIHIATHASFVPRDPLQSYLQLAGQRLTLKEIHQLKLDPGCLVVLSACESGLGQEYAGSEPVSLATAFSGAGAQAVVSGLWTVDDDATSLLFQSFYGALQAGRSPGEALREAQEATRKRYPHPYYWAAFSLLGWPD